MPTSASRAVPHASAAPGGGGHAERREEVEKNVVMPLSFLTARWSNLCLLTYAVPPALLEPRLPPGTTLDTRDGHAFVSLVAFDFLDTRVLGVPWPGYRDFPEINLRFYVRHGHDRGVVFIREYVPKRLVAFLARATYGEPYVAAPMTSRVSEDDATITVEHRLTVGGRENRLSVTGRKPCAMPAADGVEHFFKEHQWGFGTGRRGRQCIRYEVSHPHWDCYPVETYDLDWDWAAAYGPEFAFLQDAAPYSVVMAVGSAISVFPKGKLATA
jgi:uncharacterized protein YqjF (DUF2071 family)